MRMSRPNTRQTRQRARGPQPKSAEAHDPLQALYDQVPALAELAALLGHGGVGASTLSLVIAALMQLPPSSRAAAASALLARLLRARRQQRATQGLVLRAMPTIRSPDPMLAAIRRVAALLLSALLALHLAARWSDEAAAWEAMLADALDELAEDNDTPPSPVKVHQHQHSYAAGGTAAHAPAPSAGGRGPAAAQEQPNEHGRLTALIARAQAVGLTVPMPDGTNLDLSLSTVMLDEAHVADVDALELPLPPVR
jgi:hypothetical protein